MAKNINMTRERKIALPVILAAAARHLETLKASGKNTIELNRALQAFKDN